MKPPVKRSLPPPAPDPAFEPYERNRDIPHLLYWIALALAVWGSVTLFDIRHAVTKGDSKRNMQQPGPIARATPDGVAVRDPQSLPQLAIGTPQAADAVVAQLVFAGRGAAWSCASCHGALGQGHVTIPRLAGLNPAYIVRQLNDYATGKRGSASMKIVTSSLTKAEMERLALYYSSLSAPSISQPALDGDMRRGEQLALRGDWSRNVPACFSCHGPSGFGVGATFPALAAQDPAYTAAQLAGWLSGTRNRSGLALMHNVAVGLTESDRRSVADYLATLPPVPATARPQERR